MMTVLLLGVSLAHEARAFYNPSSGRWLSRDPISEMGGPNVYGFVRNNAIVNIDALGERLKIHNLPPTDVSCGNWKSFRAINRVEGPLMLATYIIQEMKITLNVYDFSGRTAVLIKSETHHYWEAFYNDAFQPITAEDTWEFRSTYGQNTLGIETRVGIAKIFGFSITGFLGSPQNPGPWWPPADQYSSYSPSTKTKPTWWDNPNTPPIDDAAVGTSLFSWSCTCGLEYANVVMTPTPY